MPLLTTTDLREQAAAALQPVLDTDPNVQDTIVDAISPPALFVFWADPWLTPATTQAGLRRMASWTARLSVMCVAGRVEPGAGIATLEELVGYVIGRLRADTYPWPAPDVSAPIKWTPAAGAPEYLACEARYRVPVYIPEGA